MTTEENLNGTIEAFLTATLLDLEKDKVSLQSLISASFYQNFYSSFNNLRNILTKHNVLNHLINAIKESEAVLKNEFNVYPLLYQKMQEYPFGAYSMTKQMEIYSLDKTPESTYINHLYKQILKSPGIGECNSIFGAYFLMETCDLRSLLTASCIANRILSVSMESFSLPIVDNQNRQIPIQSLLSMIGKSMFLGSFYPCVDSFDFRIDFLMAITDESGSTMASTIFYDVISHHLKLMSESLGAIVLDITVPNINEPPNKNAPKSSLKIKGNTSLTYGDWKNEELKPREIIKKLAEIYINDKKLHPNSIPFITVQAMVSTSGEGYHKIRIKYVPHTLRIEGNGNPGETWSCFGNRGNEFMNHVFESIFFKQAHAEAFMTLVLNQSLTIPTIGNRSLDLRSKNLHSRDNGDGAKQVQEVKSIFGVFKFPDYIPDLMKEDKPPVIPLSDNDSATWTNNLAITEKLWVEDIAKSNTLMDFFAILENTVKLIVAKSSLIPAIIDRKMLQIEVQTILQSSIYKLHRITQSNITLRQLMYSFTEHRNDELVLKQFHKFFEEMCEVLDRIRSQHNLSYANGLLQRLVGRFNRISLSGNIGTDIKELMKPKMMLELRYWNNMLYPLLWQMIGDFLLRCPNLKQLISNLRGQFPAVNYTAQVLVKVEEFSQETDFKRFIETKTAQNSEDQKMDILTYLKSKNFESYWRGFLVSILNGSDNSRSVHLFSLLSEQFNIAAISIDLERSPINNGVSDSSSSPSECVDPDNFLYKSTNHEAYGLKSALMLLDSSVFPNLTTIFASVDHKVYEKSIGIFEVAVSTGLMGQLPYFGKIDPLFRTIDVVDHIFVKGPDSCLEEGSQIFAQTIIKHIVGYKTVLMENSLMMGLFLPDLDQVWSIADITRDSREVIIQVAKSARQFGTVSTRILVPFQWRYLTIVKKFQFHFFNFQKTQYFSSMGKDNQNLDAFRLLFFSKESALTYFKKGEYLKVSQNPFSTSSLSNANLRIDEQIIESSKNQDWIDLYRALITKCMVNDNYDFVDECSKIFHGTLGYLDYLNSLNKTIQFAIFHIMESKMFSLETPVAEVKPVAKAKSKQAITPPAKTLSADILNKMFRGYYIMLLKVFENKNMTHLHLKDVLLRLINRIAETEGQKDIYVSLNEETIINLEQIRQILKFVECFYGCSSQQSCAKSFVYGQSIGDTSANVSIAMNETSDQCQERLTLKMIKSDSYKQWSTNPRYGHDF